jgi:hypothetical protein
VIKVGIIGLHDKNNGHPFSYSSIINGYSEKGYKLSEYLNILKYLKKKKTKEFKINNVKITHAWTQNLKLTKILCKASKIKNPVKNYLSMLGHIDALIIARDDKHYEISKPFLQKEIPVFIDKPLSFKQKELNFFKKYMLKKQLMSTSGLRFSSEIDILKKGIKKLGKVKFIIANVVNDWERYGVHMLDIIDEIGFLDVKKIQKLQSQYTSYNILTKKNVNIIINCLGKGTQIYNITTYGTKGKCSVDFKDNFTAFKNTLTHFFSMVDKKKLIINPNNTIKIMNLINSVSKLKKQ